MFAKYNRRSIRLEGYDYTQSGAYFVTICVKDFDLICTGDARIALNSKSITTFGQIESGQMVLNDPGRIVEECWLTLPSHHPNVILDEFVIMPNHLHFILFIISHLMNNEIRAYNEIRATQASPVQTKLGLRSGPERGSLGAIVGSFKSSVTRRINEHRGTPGEKVWHRNYYEHIIRSEDELNRIREYIFNNPINWPTDEYNFYKN